MADDSERSLREVGEFGVISRLVMGRKQPAGVEVGPGDDSAVLLTPDGRVTVTTDMLVEGRHFRLDWSTPHDVGRKAIAQNAADVAAMGARVSAFVVAFGAPPITPISQAQAFTDGMWHEADSLGAGIIGGDLVSSPQWVISVTALGDLQGRAPILRSGARPGSLIAVAGDLGWSAAGYAMWSAGLDRFPRFKQRHVVPEPPYDQGVLAAEAGALAMADVSDGLLADLGHLASASGVVMELSRAELQTDVDAVADAAEVAQIDPWSFVLTGGEDHALVGCFADSVPDGWRVIGTVGIGTPAVFVDGQRWEGPGGWQSFE